MNQTMIYSVLESPSGDRLVIAKERLVALSSSLGPDFKEIFTVQGRISTLLTQPQQPG